jgi:hypothetical protein
MLAIDRSARAPVTAPPERCRERLADIEGYSRWSSLITHAERFGDRARLRASLLGVSFEMECELELGGDRVVLPRLPNDAEDDERFEAAWTVSPGEVTLHVSATIDVPGPARLIRGRVEKRLADDLLADFVRALAAT